ncbi:hypothetical protein GCM10016272_10980 [Psychrobacter glaciei]|uniref:Uncharacterized protein n=1 Tax=Psychrobacter glaciei TaxID=619771 RepID=A0ABQ3GPA6_9GAMM|nr:hypothetical protein GCM10016272_10980 [Psychrobacter glaciei]
MVVIAMRRLYERLYLISNIYADLSLFLRRGRLLATNTFSINVTVSIRSITYSLLYTVILLIINDY